MLIESMTQDIEASGDFSNEHLAKLIKSKTRHYSRDMLDIYAGFEEDGRGHRSQDQVRRTAPLHRPGEEAGRLGMAEGW